MDMSDIMGLAMIMCMTSTKLLVVFEKKCGKTVTKVYTFGVNSWTTIQDFSCDLTGWLGKFVSGTLNWLAGVPGTSKR